MSIFVIGLLISAAILLAAGDQIRQWHREVVRLRGRVLLTFVLGIALGAYLSQPTSMGQGDQAQLLNEEVDVGAEPIVVDTVSDSG